MQSLSANLASYRGSPDAERPSEVRYLSRGPSPSSLAKKLSRRLCTRQSAFCILEMQCCRYLVASLWCGPAGWRSSDALSSEGRSLMGSRDFPAMIHASTVACGSSKKSFGLALYHSRGRTAGFLSTPMASSALSLWMRFWTTVSWSSTRPAYLMSSSMWP